MSSSIVVTDRTISARHGELALRDYRPSEPRADRTTLVWVHGGGFGSGSIDMDESDAVARALATAGTAVTTVEYDLVPRFPLIGRFRMKPSEHRYPVQAHEVVDAFLDVATQVPDGGRVYLGGASAGACLAVTAALQLRDAGARQPTGLILAYGLFHALIPEVSPALRSRLKGIAKLGIATEMVRRMTLNYVGSDALHADPEVFPGTADVRGLPPTLLVDADRDLLRASGEAFASHLRSAGVAVDALVVPDSRHGFFDKPKSAAFPEGLAALTERLQ